MVSTFITKMKTVTIHELHGEPKFCAERRSLTVDMRVPAAHVYEPGSCPSKKKQHAENRNKCTTAHPEPQGHEDQGKTMLQSSIMAVVSAVLLECALAPEKAA